MASFRNALLALVFLAACAFGAGCRCANCGSPTAADATVFSATFTASATASATASCPNGTTASATGSATVTETATGSTQAEADAAAKKKATDSANAQAHANAQANVTCGGGTTSSQNVNFTFWVHSTSCTGEPIIGATVYVNGVPYTTDSTGHVTVTLSANTSFNWSVVANGYTGNTNGSGNSNAGNMDINLSRSCSGMPPTTPPTPSSFSASASSTRTSSKTVNCPSGGTATGSGTATRTATVTSSVSQADAQQRAQAQADSDAQAAADAAALSDAPTHCTTTTPPTPTTCTYAVEATPINFTWNPTDNAGVVVSTSSPTCTWTVSPNAFWVVINKAGGTGGGDFKVSAAGNGGAARNSSVTFNGQGGYTVTIPVSQGAHP